MRKALGLLLLLVLACPTGSRQGPTRQYEAGVLRRAELAEEQGSLCPVAERLRPQWFVGERAVVSVYLEETYHGSAPVLCGFMVEDVEEVRRLDEAETLLRFGSLHAGPSLVVRLRRQ